LFFRAGAGIFGALMPESFHEVDEEVLAPAGFVAGASACGVKEPGSTRLDLGILYSLEPTVAAATFTSNRVKAAPVRVSQSHFRNDDVRAMVVNSGNANACTGLRGLEDAKAMARATAGALGLRQQQVAVCSTGIIGVPLPVDRVLAGIPGLASDLQAAHWPKLARAIMTSDKHPKMVSVRCVIGGKPVHISGMAKGAGMICPNMATMLAFLATDAVIDRKTLQAITRCAVEQSFNRISVDGDMSTNDTAMVLANGTANNRKIVSTGGGAKVFREALTHVMLALAKKMVRDGEGVSKLVEIAVKGAASFSDAQKIAEAVANSSLVKCSWNGSDPNWGRVMHAIGYAGARIREELIDIYFDGLVATRNGLATDTPIGEMKKVVQKESFTVGIDLHLGDADYTVYTSDLSEEYVAYNRLEYALKLR